MAVMNTLIPHQKTGKAVDLSHSLDLSSREEAVVCYRQARARLLQPNAWHELCGVLSAAFFLVQQRAVAGHAQMNDHIRINIPGPGPSSGQGYDWVEIKLIEERTDATADNESIGMKVCPCSDPTNKDKNVAHFFTNEASSTFVISRNGNTVSAHYYGRNETPNINTGSTGDNIRNAIVASGAMASLSEMQWMSLIKAFLNNDLS